MILLFYYFHDLPSGATLLLLFRLLLLFFIFLLFDFLTFLLLLRDGLDGVASTIGTSEIGVGVGSTFVVSVCNTFVEAVDSTEPSTFTTILPPHSLPNLANF